MDSALDKQNSVVLLGNSLLLDGVAISLGERLQASVLQLEPSMPDIAERLNFLHPRLIIFDLDSPCSASLWPVLKEQKGTFLMGLNSECCQVVLIESNQHSIRSMQDFCQLVQMISENGTSMLAESNKRG
jgi:hypothetical protein